MSHSAENANNTIHYVQLTLFIIVGLIGVYFRFLGDSFTYTSISNVILVIAIIFTLRTVFRIMK
jgi:hypothetical protein